MSYLVFGLGLLLSLCGAWSIYFGYGIIAVERGWASVIAGATALSCGVVTVALAFVLHSLAQLRNALTDERGYEPLGEEWAQEPAAPPHAREQIALGERVEKEEPQLLPETAPWSEAAEERAERTRVFSAPPVEPPPRIVRAPEAAGATRKAPESRPETRNVSRASIDDVRRLVADQLKGAPPTQSRGGYDAGARDVAEDVGPLAGEAAFDGAAPQSAGLPPASSLAPEGAGSAPGRIEERPETNAAPCVPAAVSPEEVRQPAQAETQWSSVKTSEAFLALGPNILGRQILGPPIPPGARAESADRATAGRQPYGEERGAIVGSYESGGTSYVMYADGSIDAQSERGAFRFNSMAELKAFLDAQP